ncbi:ammonia-dependent NAD(+) synthetase [Corynebacterium choanae]|uniref:NH(3)-dependent NAD(+) synthetase n=1 Tax=Corynebacterium choanae TaxID=1862358 RepID=A0A3G6J4J5_9CORY|nr:ammonia-dependent NAD(+) synthetase [Corynebacterium choanae]AZA12866.1 NH(3)-dependent NAD(+) synthetase [Corynebacterium choanae]
MSNTHRSDDSSASIQQTVIDRNHVAPTIDPAAEVHRRIRFLADYLLHTGLRGYVLGISGGQDSTLAGRLAQRAVEDLREQGHDAKFVAVRLPYRVQQDEADAQIALDFIQPDETITINIAPATDALAEQVAASLSKPEMTDFDKGNVKARMRMTAQYAIAGEFDMLVIGTDHAAENVTGFFTKFGDGAADILPLAGLTKSQGAALLRELGAPDSTWQKVPTADLEDDRPMLADEQALGVTYSEIDAYLTGEEVTPAARQRLDHLWQIGEHKRHLPVTPFDTWWT